jgi:GLPGLI family protein
MAWDCVIFSKTLQSMIKSISILVSIIFLLLSSKIVMAQKQFSEGSLQYDISITTGKTETPIANSLNGASLTIYLRPFYSRTEMKSTLGTETTVYDNKAGTGFILKEYSGQKLMISMNANNWAEKNKLYENLNFSISDDIINIGEHKCRKATAQLQEGKIFTVYFNPEIVIANKKYNNAFAQLPGLPVQYELQSGNLNFKYVLSKISYDAISQSRFEAPKTGFRVMTYDENQQLKKSK